MKILFLTAGDATVASSRIRVYQYVPYLQRAWIRCIIIPITNARQEHKSRTWKLIKRRFNSGIRYFKIPFYSIVCDVVFIQKVLLPIGIQNLIRTLNSNIVFDFDDAIWLWYQSCAEPSSAVRRRLLRHTIERSKYVITLENDYLKKFALKFTRNILMVTGPVDCKRLFPKREKENKNIVIGWIGSPPNTPYLKPLFNVFKRISENHPNVIIELVGASNLKIEGVNLVIKQWCLDTEVENLHDFDIGIMPLPDDKWTRGKGGYKLLQYMAVGIPCIASPVGINSILIREDVNGYLANSEDEWYEKLEILIKNRVLRESMGANGRKLVEEQYSLEAAVPKLIKLVKRVGTKQP